MEQRSGVHLIGGGWAPAVLTTMYEPLLDEAGADPRIACLVVDEGDGAARFERWRGALSTAPRAAHSRCWSRSTGSSAWDSWTRTACWSAVD